MSLVDFTAFDAGWSGWLLKYWMPNGREVKAQIMSCKGFARSRGVRIYADGRGDDGIFFLEKIFQTPSKIEFVSLSWFFAEFNPEETINQWPRIVYVGAVDDLARPDRQHDFEWLQGRDLLTELGDKRWNIQHYVKRLEPIEQFQVSLGWKINWETERMSYLDNLVVMAE